MSTAVRAANRASLEPSVARRILVGKMLISPPSLGAVCGKRMMSSGRAPRIIEEGRFGIKPGANFVESPFLALWGIRQEVSKLQLQVTNVSLAKEHLPTMEVISANVRCR